jgi:saccharopine dehydrogenase-like NADP-dependent oxidoreductase
VTPPEQAPSGAVTAGVIGVGATGARAARQLASADEVDVVVLGGPGERPDALRQSLGTSARVGDPLDAGARVVVLAGPAGTHADAARRCLERGIDVVSTSDAVDDVEALLGLDQRARSAGRRVVVGAGFSPGLSSVLARHLADWVDEVDEVHLARFGTGGPACARQHHRALAAQSVDWRDGEWLKRRAGSGRELAIFPDPVGSLDCYRAALPDAVLLQRAFPGASRIAARQAANRRQRLLAFLPMLRRPHPEGRIGAIRVEVRGRRDGRVVCEVAGAIDRPAVAAGAVAGLAARWCLAGRIAPGAAGLAETVEPVPFLHELSDHGVRAAVFVGVA